MFVRESSPTIDIGCLQGCIASKKFRADIYNKPNVQTDVVMWVCVVVGGGAVVACLRKNIDVSFIIYACIYLYCKLAVLLSIP